MRKRGLAAAAVVGAIVLAIVLIAQGSEEPRDLVASTPSTPNVIVIEADDQSLNLFNRETMPNTFRILVDHGTEFTQGIAAPPLCCPSRAGFLTGQYPHNHGVFSNTPGYPRLIDRDLVLPAWLQAAGYRTGLVGKYLNGTKQVHGTDPAPGWDEWVETEPSPKYRGSTVSVNGEVSGPVEYMPETLNDEAVRFVEESADDAFFLWLSQTPPHIRRESGEGTGCRGRVAKPLERDLRATSGVELPSTPNFNEADVSDKPEDIRTTSALDKSKREEVELAYRCAAATMRSVDRGVKDIWAALVAAGVEDETVVIYTSDHGLFYGEHRVPGRKGKVYEEAVRVPMAMRVPTEVLGGIPERRVDEQIANLDLTPTILDLAGGDPCTSSGDCRVMDGRTATPLLRGDGEGWPDDRALLLEEGDSKGKCKFAGLRTERFTYSVNLELEDDECVAGERELYLLDEDPFQLENRIDDPGTAPIVARLERRLERLRGCSGTDGPDACE